MTRSFVVIMVALAACAGARPASPHFAPDDRAAIAGVLERQSAAWNRGDLAGFMDGYAHTPALIFTSGGKLRRGWQDAFDHFQARYGKDPSAMGTLVFTIDTVTPVGAAGDAALVIGRFDLSKTENAGHGVFTLVFERRPEGWRIVHDHTSAGSP
ncbi:MAG TPA: nuclear transport factor 2 family protein [Kofleriaceae bacterium]|nr:nuclear transport factor 2 family protein [Kofleriaceae bacterium]